MNIINHENNVKHIVLCGFISYAKQGKCINREKKSND